jgi:T5SS/PEP-CTERM-associated repeat protein
MKPRFLFTILAAILFGGSDGVMASTNSWIAGNGKWETTTNWSLGFAPNFNETAVITNVGNKTITADLTTFENFFNSLSISNLVLSGPANSTNTLFLNDALVLTTTGGILVRTNGILQVTSTALIVEGLGSGGDLTVDGGTISLNNSSINGTNSSTTIGYSGHGQMTISNGTWLARDITIGQIAGSDGTLTMMACTNTVRSELSVPAFFWVGINAGSTGTVWMTGRQLTVDDNTFSVIVGSSGIGQMTVSNGTWLAGSVDLGFSGGSQGTLTIAGGTNIFMEYLGLGSESSTATGTVWMTGGLLTVTNNGTTYVGGEGSGRMTVSNGTWLASDVYVGYLSGAGGTLTFAGGATAISSVLDIAVSANATGTVWMAGGQLTVTNNVIGVGDRGVGQMTVSNGTCRTRTVDVGYAVGSEGTLTLAGGTIVATSMDVGANQNATGTVLVTGGQLIVTNQSVAVGLFGVGKLTVEGGSVLATELDVGEALGAQGTFTISGGTSTVLSDLTIGDCDSSSMGFVVVRGGNLFVTNATHTAVLDVENGWVILGGGLLKVDTLVMTNGCGVFVEGGGTLIVSNLVLNPDLDDDDDGIPNGYEQAHGMDPLNPADANQDNDGDGFSNLQEYLAGTDPNDPDSTPFHITSITQQGNNILLAWTTLGGTTNQVQVTGGTGGNYATNNFTNLGAQMLISGGGTVITNYTDMGGATNKPARYYRVRLVP